MPEYLAPGVYVEEIPSGSKPIEGASTSTAAMVGMTQRGPVNVPTLVTSFGSFARTFGGYLHPDFFPGGRDALPYAADGFFTNGGSRVYITRIVGANADESTLMLSALAAGEAAGARTLGAAAQAGASSIDVAGAAGIVVGDLLTIADGARSERVTVSAVASGSPSLLLAGPLDNDYSAGDVVTLQTATAIAGVLQADLAIGDTQLSLDDATGVAVGAVLWLRDSGADRSLDEFLTVSTVTPGPTVTVDFTPALANDHFAASTLSVLADSATTAALAADTVAGTDPAVLPVPSEAGFAADSAIRITDGGVANEFAVLTAVQPASATVTLAAPLLLSHAAGTAVSRTVSALEVHALSPGSWGDSLRVWTREAAQVQTVLSDDAAAADDTIALATAFGLFPGSILSIGGTPAELASVDAATGIVTLTAPLGADHPAATAVISQEFSLFVERIENGKAAESETFEKLSLAPGHPRNAMAIVGSWNNATDTPSRAGTSNLIRLAPPTVPAPLASAFLHGLTLHLAGGVDDAAGVTDATYVGTPSDDPAARTGIQALENEPAVSLVAVPGQTSVAVQGALIAHCERMRYRFAVLDTPLGARLADARTHRQNYDTTRAAVYYPGLVIADRFAPPGELRPIMPSGHMLGIMARTDATRGVHKAPANEVVRGILQFETKLGKGEQDILNPLHVNCFRDFREQNRGLRIYGARVATSDPEFKYINVRRLLIFIEQSLDTGLQWAVFEPNDQPLWDTVKQSTSNFLITVWRSGALAGLKQEEAFFVNIGYNITMTQDDIDNGRMIVEIGVAPVKPAEFVIVRISQKTREATS
jgi:phage tail sheath protein FI